MKIAFPFGISINMSPETCSTPIYNQNIKTEQNKYNIC